jgi:hypothetical protein
VIGRRPKKNLEAVNLLDLAPFRLAEWQDVDDRKVLERPRPRGYGVSTWRDWVAFHLSMRHIRLDDFGSRAWSLFDGRRTVRQAAAELRQQFGDEIEPAEERLGEFVRQLRRECLLGYPGFDDSA